MVLLGALGGKLLVRWSVVLSDVYLKDGFYEMWESLTLDIEDVRDKGDRVVALYTNRARGRDGVEVRRQGAQVITVRDGLAFRTTYASWKEALRAAGLDD